MFREETSSFEGRYYTIRNARNLPRPVRAGGPPIMIGGGGEKRTLRLVAQYGDMCNVTGDPDMIRHKIDVIGQHCADVGRDPSEVRITRMATMFLTNSADETKQVQEFVSNAAGPEMVGAAQIGQEDDIASQVAELIAAGVDELIFNMPLSDPEGIRRAGKVLESVVG
jgi:alkanesulfonate monooxygenase SsuD/methylene tetrahydromethanopterin reductase-like flavin-dependent oxidoreductase (luciferase family)